MLLERGSSLFQRDSVWGWNALHFATSAGRVGMVRMLIEWNGNGAPRGDTEESEEDEDEERGWVGKVVEGKGRVQGLSAHVIHVSSAP